MRSVPIDLGNELAAAATIIVHLLQIDFASGTERYTDCDHDIFHGGAWYYSRGLVFDPGMYTLQPKIDNTTVEIDDIDRTLTAIIMAEEVRNKKVTILKAAVDTALQVIGTVTVFIGYIDGGEGDEESVRFQVSSHLIKWKTPTPRRQHEPNCRWTFKDPETCRYAGVETWCDFSWARCTALSNSLNFGGNRWLLSIQNKPVYWGRVPK